MRFPLRFGAYLTAFVATTSALSFTSPSSGSSIDPTQPILVTWSVSYTDPSVFDLKISGSGSDVVLAHDVVTYTGTYTVPAETIGGTGSGWSLVAVGNSNTIGQATGLSFGGLSSQSSSVQTSTVAQVTLTSTQTVIPTPEATNATGSTVPTASIDSVGVTTMSSTASDGRTPATTSTPGSGFVTSTTTGAARTNSATSSAATASQANTASGQKRLGGELVLCAAWLVAGSLLL